MFDSRWLITKEILDTTDEADFIHDFFKSVMMSMTNEAVSLLDVPALLGTSDPFTSPVDVSLKVFVFDPELDLQSIISLRVFGDIGWRPRHGIRMLDV